MSKIIYIIFLLGFIQLAEAQNETYTIVRVKGTITNLATNKPLVPGDVINATDKLKFGDLYAQAIVISNTRGKFTLTMPQDDLFDENNLLAVADNAASPIQSRSQMSTRNLGGGSCSNLEDYFGIDDTYFVIGDYFNITMDKIMFPLGTQQYVMVSFEFHGEKITKQIEAEDQLLKIDKFTLVTKKECKLEHDTLKNIAITYTDLISMTEEKTNLVQLIFLHKNLLFDECDVIKATLKKQGLTHREISSYLFTYITEVYGKTDSTILSRFIADEANPEIASGQ